MRRRLITFILVLAFAMALLPAALAADQEEGTADEPLSQESEEEINEEPGEGPDDEVLSQEPETDDKTQSQPSDWEDTGPEEQSPEEESATVATLNTTDHISYIKGTGLGRFSPDSYITRAEAAVILYRLLSDTAPVTVSYTDVPESSWYAEAAGQLGSLGVIRPNKSTFNGSEIISRGEFASYIACFFPMRTDAEQFPDVRPDYGYRDAILSGRAWGWLTGLPDGSFSPGSTVSRAEAVTILNRALGRTGDQASITANRPALFLDVPVTAWYYYDVMEATVPHTFATTETGDETWTTFTETDTGLPADFRTDGFHLYEDWSYRYSADAKDIIRSRTDAGFTFDANGHFTTGDTWVDQQLRNIILSKTNSSMTREEMLRALFAHCRDDYKYLKWNLYAAGDTSFMLDAVRHFLSTGRGNCYCYASTFWYLARWIGYDAKIYSGIVFRNGTPHCWVEIGGYIYDTQLEWRYVHDYGRSGYLWSFYHMLDTNDTYRYRK